MDNIKIYWIEDKKPFVIGLLKRLKFSFEDLNFYPELNGLSFNEFLEKKDIWKFCNDKRTVSFEHTDYIYEIQLMAKWAAEAENSMFFIDFNLKDHNDEGINGDEIIKEIRRHNNCKIIFYSSESSQEGLRAKIGELQNVECIAREHLFDFLSANFNEFF